MDGKIRCIWCGDNPIYVDYHDNEWGDLYTMMSGFSRCLSWRVCRQVFRG